MINQHLKNLADKLSQLQSAKNLEKLDNINNFKLEELDVDKIRTAKNFGKNKYSDAIFHILDRIEKVKPLHAKKLSLSDSR